MILYTYEKSFLPSVLNFIEWHSNFPLPVPSDREFCILILLLVFFIFLCSLFTESYLNKITCMWNFSSVFFFLQSCEHTRHMSRDDFKLFSKTHYLPDQ